MWWTVSGSGSSATYMPGGFWSRTAPRISSRSSAARNARTRYSRSWSTSSPSGSGGRIESVANVVTPCRTRRGRRPLSTRDTRRPVSRSAPFTLDGRPRRAGAAATRATPPSSPRRPRSTARRTATPRCPRRRARWPRYIDRLLARREPGRRAVRPAPRSHDGGSSAARASWSCAGGAAGREPDEVEIGGTWLAADAQRTPINTEAKLLLLTHAFEVWGVGRVAMGHRRAQRAQPGGDRAPRGHVRGRPAPPPPVDRRRRGGPAARHGAVRDHRRRVARRRRAAASSGCERAAVRHARSASTARDGRARRHRPPVRGQLHTTPSQPPPCAGSSGPATR